MSTDKSQPMTIDDVLHAYKVGWSRLRELFLFEKDQNSGARQMITRLTSELECSKLALVQLENDRRAQDARLVLNNEVQANVIADMKRKLSDHANDSTISDLKTSLAKERSVSFELRKKLGQVGVDLNQVRMESKSALTRCEESWRAECDILLSRIDEMESTAANVDSLQQRLLALEGLNADLSSKLTVSERAGTELSSHLRESRESAKSLLEELRTVKYQKDRQIQNLESEKNGLRDELTVMENKVMCLNSEMGDMGETEVSMRRVLEERVETIAGLKSSVRELSSLQEEQKKESSQNIVRIGELETTIGKVSQDNAGLVKELGLAHVEIERSRQAVQLQKARTKELMNRLNAFADSRRMMPLIVANFSHGTSTMSNQTVVSEIACHGAPLHSNPEPVHD